MVDGEAMWQLTLVLVALLGAGAAAQAEDQFQPQCPVPFAGLEVRHPIDATCPPEGVATSQPGQAQNRLKGNFCADSAATALSFYDFQSLQNLVDQKGVSYGADAKIPEGRTVLKDLVSVDGGPVGEGSVVRYVAFLSHPRYASRESVNCRTTGTEWFDIHMDLVRKAGEVACRSITAEIIPHLRPELWEVEYLKEVERQHVPVRITGQLFFDASHRPCHGDQDTINPKRSTIWEIHPVYGVEVCKYDSLQACSATNDTRWVPLDRWINPAGEED